MSRDILIDLIDADPDQPRRNFDPELLAELAASIKANGLAVPILLRPVGGRFVIVHGERRFRACRSLGWTTIPADVRDLDEETARWLALVENIQRADLSPIEEAQAYEAALATGLTQKQLGERVGKSQSYIAQKLRLLKMPPEVQAAIADGAISEGIARQLLRLEPERHDWARLVANCLAEGWSVRRAKNYADYELLVWYPQWWDVAGKFADLVEFEKRLEEECRRGYAPAEHHLWTQRALGQHLTFAKKVFDAGAPQLGAMLLEDAPLSLLNEWGRFASRFGAPDTNILDSIKAHVFWGTVKDPLAKIEANTITADRADYENWNREMIRRACAWFDAHWADEMRAYAAAGESWASDD